MQIFRLILCLCVTSGIGLHALSKKMQLFSPSIQC